MKPPPSRFYREYAKFCLASFLDQTNLKIKYILVELLAKIANNPFRPLFLSFCNESWFPYLKCSSPSHAKLSTICAIAGQPTFFSWVSPKPQNFGPGSPSDFERLRAERGRSEQAEDGAGRPKVFKPAVLRGFRPFSSPGGKDQPIRRLVPGGQVSFLQGEPDSLSFDTIFCTWADNSPNFFHAFDPIALCSGR